MEGRRLLEWLGKYGHLGFRIVTHFRLHLIPSSLREDKPTLQNVILINPNPKYPQTPVITISWSFQKIYPTPPAHLPTRPNIPHRNVLIVFTEFTIYWFLNIIKIQTKVLWKEAKNSHAPHQENILAKLLPKLSGSKCEANLSKSVGSVEDELFNWRICFQALNPPFEGGLYEAIIKFLDDFPTNHQKWHSQPRCST